MPPGIYMDGETVLVRDDDGYITTEGAIVLLQKLRDSLIEETERDDLSYIIGYYLNHHVGEEQ